ncbi:MAG: alpha-amylase family glycosyl hydrolase [Deltaproteobacteria bacterium]
MKDKYLIIIIFLFTLCFNIAYSQNAIVGTGFSSGWGGGSCPTGTGNFNWFSNSFGTSFIGTFSPNSTGNQYFRLGIGWDNTSAHRTITIGSDVYVNPKNEYQLNSQCTTNGALYYNVPNINYKYVFKTKNAGVNPDGKLIFFEIQGDVRTVASVTQSPDALNVGASTPVTVTAQLNGNINPGQGVYLRYSTSPNWSTSSTLEMTGSGNVFSGIIPQFPANTVVSYYVFTSGNALTITHDKADWYTINGNTNNGQNFNYTVLSGVVTVAPSFPNDSEPVTITLDASGTPLEGVSKVYLHSGVSVNQSTPKAFNYAKGNWGQDDGIGEMTNTGGNNWQIILTQGLRNYYDVPPDKDIFGLNFLFRNAAGDKKVDKNGQNYYNAVNPGNYFTTNAQNVPVNFVQTGNSFGLSATANTVPDTWTLTEIDINTNAWISTLAFQNGNLNFTYSIGITTTNLRKFKLEANFGGTTKYKTFYIMGYLPVTIESRPSWTKPGINYHASDPTRVTLVLHAPTYTRFKKGTGAISGNSTTTAKNVVYVVGDFNNWTPGESNKMKRDRDGWDGSNDSDGDEDRGDYWWIEISGLLPGQEYVFQYMIDGNIQVGDPFANKISDPDDQYISSAVYPDLITYRPQAVDRATVLRTGQTVYNWTAPTFTKPGINELNIYELHFRDFTEEGTYLAAIEKLDYLRGLGVNAIHVMPVSEFEGNSSWGYNPNFYFAPDKAYGTANDLKKFIDECHMRKIQVFNDIVLNHAFYSNVMAKMYWNSTLNRPADDNPWFNPVHKMIYDSNGHWGADWNHESEHVQNMVDRILDYWLQEFKFDGFRFDFTKGFGQSAPNPDDPWASNYNQDRIDLLLRMANGMKSRNPGSVVIFEHLAASPEERTIANTGILMWSGIGHHNAIKNFIIGWPNDNTDIYSSGVFNSSQNGFTYANLISYPESHDEQRQAYNVKSYFNWAAYAGPKITASDSLNAIINRLKIGLGFNLFLQGPRMLWQFEEIGYDVSIDYNGRTGEKPVRWNYYDNLKRRELYNLVSRIFKIRNNYNIYHSVDYGNIGLPGGNIATPRRMRFSTNDGKHIVIIANLDPAAGHDAYPNYPVTGTWYKYNGDPATDGTSFSVSNTGSVYYLNYSEMMVLTNFQIDRCTDVRNNNDSGPHSLRSAISCALPGETVTIEYPVFGNTITLSAPAITIDKNLIIQGFISRNVTVNGSGLTDPVFTINTGNAVNLNGIKLNCSQGNQQGRCILNNGTLTLDNMELSEPVLPTGGSTIINQGSVTIKNNVKVK